MRPAFRLVESLWPDARESAKPLGNPHHDATIVRATESGIGETNKEIRSIRAGASERSDPARES